MVIAKKIIYTMSENKLILSNVLYAEGIPVGSPIMLNFCGEIITTLSELKNLTSVHIVYLTISIWVSIIYRLEFTLKGLGRLQRSQLDTSQRHCYKA